MEHDAMITGVIPILSMPFDARGRIDVEDLAAQVEWMVGAGVHGVGIAMASEVFKLTEAERDEVLRVVVAQARHRVKVVMNTGAEGTDVAIDYSRRAQELGADALMVRPTTYAGASFDEHVDYFVRIAEAVTIPIFLQDQPASPVPPALAAECARRHPNLRYVKVEVPPTVPRTLETVRLGAPHGLAIFGGWHGLFFVEELRRGAVGTMPGSAPADLFVRVWDLYQEGKIPEAEREFHRHQALLRTFAQSLALANWLYKHALWRRGVIKRTSVHARPPSFPPDDEQMRELDRLLEQLGLVEPSSSTPSAP
jgi:4-hydroxy-tetrahydrodipicolinate synthase